MRPTFFVCGNASCSEWQILQSVRCRLLLILHVEDRKSARKLNDWNSVVLLIYLMLCEVLYFSRLQLWQHMLKIHCYKTWKGFCDILCALYQASKLYFRLLLLWKEESDTVCLSVDWQSVDSVLLCVNQEIIDFKNKAKITAHTLNMVPRELQLWASLAMLFPML